MLSHFVSSWKARKLSESCNTRSALSFRQFVESREEVDYLRQENASLALLLGRSTRSSMFTAATGGGVALRPSAETEVRVANAPRSPVDVEEEGSGKQDVMIHEFMRKERKDKGWSLRTKTSRENINNDCEKNCRSPQDALVNVISLNTSTTSGKKS